MLKDNSKKRVEKLFSEIQQIANGDRPPDGEPAMILLSEQTQFSDPAVLLEEMETLRARVQELEARLSEQETKKRSASIVYEKEEVGFAYLDDKVMPIR